MVYGHPCYFDQPIQSFVPAFSSNSSFAGADTVLCHLWLERQNRTSEADFHHVCPAGKGAHTPENVGRL